MNKTTTKNIFGVFVVGTICWFLTMFVGEAVFFSHNTTCEAVVQGKSYHPGYYTHSTTTSTDSKGRRKTRHTSTYHPPTYIVGVLASDNSQIIDVSVQSNKYPYYHTNQNVLLHRRVGNYSHIEYLTYID